MKTSYEQRIREMELEINQIQTQRDQVLVNMQSSNLDQNEKLQASRQDYEQRLKNLKSQLGSYRQKLKESQKMISVKEKDSMRIQKLESEVDKIKINKVRLQKQMKKESEKHREWSDQKKREIIILQKKARQRDIEV